MISSLKTKLEHVILNAVAPTTLTIQLTDVFKYVLKIQNIMGWTTNAFRVAQMVHLKIFLLELV